MANDNNNNNPRNANWPHPHGHNQMDSEARAYLNELSADEDAARDDWDDDGECFDREDGINPDEDLPEMEIIMNNIYVM